MSKLGVRNIDGYNQRVGQAEKKGEPITRTVQTGFDRETGEAIYETEKPRDGADSLHRRHHRRDGRSDDGCRQGHRRGRAVGLANGRCRGHPRHPWATQRPSVDVITGTITGPLPETRTPPGTSKIDSRTNLGEQGANELLHPGRHAVHAGRHASSACTSLSFREEVESVVANLKDSGVADYLDAIAVDVGDR